MKLFKTINKELLNINILDKKIQIKSRNSDILPLFLNKQLLIYNGKIFQPIFITKEHLNNKMGNYSLTRKHCIHSRPKLKNKIRIKKI